MDWALTIIGLTGFILVGEKKWWAWYINLANQILWAIYALTTDQYGFLLAVVFYVVVFGINAYKWTKNHRAGVEI